MNGKEIEGSAGNTEDGQIPLVAPVSISSPMGVGHSYGTDLDGWVNGFHGSREHQEVRGILSGGSVSDFPLAKNFIPDFPVLHPIGGRMSTGHPLPCPISYGLPVSSLLIDS